MVTLAELRLFAKYHFKRRVYDHPAQEHELGVQLLGYDPVAYAERMRALAERDGVTVEQLDSIDYRDDSYPVFLVQLGPSDARKQLLVLAGVHGNEQAGLLAVEDIVAAADRESDVALAIVTPVNPVGAAHNSRYNGQGYDINRDFVRFDTREAKLVVRVSDRLSPDFVVSLHEGPQAATFAFVNRWVSDDLARSLVATLEAGGTELARVDYFKRKLATPGVAPMSWGYYFLTQLWARGLGMAATATWFDDRGIPEITLESSWRSEDRAARVRAHVDLVAAVRAAM